MNGRADGKSLEPHSAGGGVPHLAEAARTIAAGPPAAGRVFHISIKDIAATLKAYRDAIGCAPFVERAGIEEAEQHVELPSRAHQFSGCAE
jgi:hypothetical protein